MINREPVIHGSPEKYVHNLSLFDRLYLIGSNKGYMDKKTFYKIMKEVFIPYVNEERKRSNDLSSDLFPQHAVLIVDDHKSRYYAPTFEILKETNTYLIILPAHSSHVFQKHSR